MDSQRLKYFVLFLHSRCPADDVREVKDAALSVRVLEDDAPDVLGAEVHLVDVHNLHLDPEWPGPGHHAADRLGMKLVRQKESEKIYFFK